MTWCLRPCLISFRPVFPVTPAHTLLSLEHVTHLQFHALVHGVVSTCYSCTSFVKSLYIFRARVKCYFLYNTFYVLSDRISLLLLLKWNLSVGVVYHLHCIWLKEKKSYSFWFHLCFIQCLTNTGYPINTEQTYSWFIQQIEQTLRKILIYIRHISCIILIFLLAIGKIKWKSFDFDNSENMP